MFGIFYAVQVQYQLQRLELFLNCDAVTNSACMQDPADNTVYKCLCPSGYKGSTGEAACTANSTYFSPVIYFCRRKR